MAKLTTAEFIEAIKELSVLELNDLVKACEEEFGVSAAAGVVVAAAGPAEAAEEKTEFDVELTEVGASYRPWLKGSKGSCRQRSQGCKDRRFQGRGRGVKDQAGGRGREGYIKIMNVS